MRVDVQRETKEEIAMKMTEKTSGTLAVAFTYVCWGLLTLFWNLLSAVNPLYILTQRIVWSMVFMGIYMLVLGKWKEILEVFRDGKKLLICFVSGILITVNWGVYIYAVNSGHVLDASLGYFIEPILALDRISLHNAYFPETRLTVLGFGKDSNNDFKIVVEQPFIKGERISDDEIAQFMEKMGFKLYNPRNWTFATPEIYLSDMHDENVIRSQSGNIFVIDCDIRINTPELKCAGIRTLTTEIE